MSKIFKALFFLLILLNVFFSSWYVLNGDLRFTSDIAKFFFLFKEIGEKGIVLIGAKSSTNLFHGPLWFYLNYPAYFIGNGNPIVVGWFWVILGLSSVVINFYVGKELFGRMSAYLFALMTSIYISFHTNVLFNSHGAMFLIPLFFLFFVRYFQTSKLGYLILHIILGIAIIQFQLADGIPLMILSFLAVAYKALKERRFKDILGYILVPLLLSNFVIFDFRHNHIMFGPLRDFLSPNVHGQTFNYLIYIPKKIQMMMGGVEIIRRDPGNINLFLFIFFLAFLYKQIKNNEHKLIYFSFIYFYFGYFVLSLINKGDILYFYFYPLFPLVFLIFSSFITSKYNKLFLLAFVVILLFNESNAIIDIRDSKSIVGKDIYSWKFLHEMSLTTLSGNESEFGYFVYAPDIVAYEGQYAMDYLSRTTIKKLYRSQKKKITYLIIAPPPPNNPYQRGEWWIENMVKIKKEPISIKIYGNGYEVRKYLLNDEELRIRPDPNLDPRLTFR